MRVLITCGGTEEAIDNVRSITNFSTGNTGSFLADYLFQHGVEIIFLHSRRSILPKEILHMEKHEFISFDDLNNSLKRVLSDKKNQKLSAIVHLAAVSDYTIKNIEIDGQTIEKDIITISKVSSNASEIKLVLRPTFKIIDQIKNYFKNHSDFYTPLVIGFKLTSTNDKRIQNEKINNLFSRNTVDYVVHNDMSNLNERRVFKKYSSHDDGSNVVGPLLKNKEELAAMLLNIIKEFEIMNSNSGEKK